MGIRFIYDSESSAVKTFWEGDLDQSAIDQYLDELVELSYIKPGWVEIIDMAGVNKISLNYNSIISLSRKYGSLTSRGCTGSIIYAPEVFTYGVARMIQSIYEYDGYKVEISRYRNKLDILVAKLRASPYKMPIGSN